MDFVTGVSFYFNTILDATTYISGAFFVLGLWILLYPKRWDTKTIIHRIVLFVLTYAIYIPVQGLFFALSMSFPGREVGQFFFVFYPPLFAAIFVFAFLRWKVSQQLLTVSMLVSSALVVEAFSKNMGFFIGSASSNVFILVVIGRSAPYLFFGLTCFFIRFIDIRKYKYVPKELLIIVNSISLILIAVGLFQHAYGEMAQNVTILLSVVDFLLLMLMDFAFFASAHNVESRQRILDLEVAANLGRAERAAVKVDTANREELQKLRHDLKNHLNYLMVLLDKGDVEGAKEYLKDYSESKTEVLNSFSCSNSLINAIVNLELTKAKIADIELDVKAAVPPSLPFSKTDLCSLVTNMVDNAIQNYHSDEKEKVELRIFKQNDYVRFMCKNPIDPSKIDPENPTVSHKKKAGHGYGTKIIADIASSNGGYSIFQVDGNYFVCDVVLNLADKEMAHA